MIALGAIVPASVFYFRWRMASSTAFEKHGRKHKLNVAFWIVVLKTYWPRMIGTCLCWALYNAVAYPFGLFTSTIIDQLSGGQDSIVHSIGFGTLVNAFLIPVSSNLSRLSVLSIFYGSRFLLRFPSSSASFSGMSCGFLVVGPHR